MQGAPGYAVVDHALTRLVVTCRSAGFLDLADAAEQLRSDCRGGRARIAIVGEFNRGKTTLVNRLLGEDLLPTGPVPTTRCLTEICHGSPARICLRYPDGAERDLSPAQLAALEDDDLTGEEALRVQHPDPLLQSLTIIDTPGINDLDQARSDLVYRVLPSSDAIILVLSADQALTSSEWRFLESHLLAGERQHLLVVLTKGDLLSEADRGAVRSRVEAALGRVMPIPRVVLTGWEDGPEPGETPADRLTDVRTWLNEAIAGPTTSLGIGLLAWRLKSLLANVELRVERHTRARLDDAELARAERAARSEQLDALERQKVRMLDRLSRRFDLLSETVAVGLVRDVQAFAESLDGQLKTVTLEEARRHLPGYVRSTITTILERGRESLQRGSVDLLVELTSDEMPTPLPAAVDGPQTPLPPVLRWDESLHELGFNRFLFWAKLTGAAGLALNPMVGAGLLAASATAAWLTKDARDSKQLADMGAGARRALLAGLPELRDAVRKAALETRTALEVSIDALFREAAASIGFAADLGSDEPFDPAQAAAALQALAEIRTVLAGADPVLGGC